MWGIIYYDRSWETFFQDVEDDVTDISDKYWQKVVQVLYKQTLIFILSGSK
jgi:hypothetical protein